MSTVESEVWQALRQVKFPGMTRDIVSFGFVQRVAVTEAGAAETGATVRVEMTVQTANAEGAARVRDEVEARVRELPGVAVAEVALEVRAPAAPSKETARNPQLLSGVRRIVAVASGKGGVGKSTVAANLALAPGQDRQRGRPDGRRHLRPQRADHVGHRRPPASRSEPDAAAAREVRPQAHVAGLPRRRRAGR